jgi:hypothetical protein
VDGRWHRLDPSTHTHPDRLLDMGCCSSLEPRLWHPFRWALCPSVARADAVNMIGQAASVHVLHAFILNPESWIAIGVRVGRHLGGLAGRGVGGPQTLFFLAQAGCEPILHMRGFQKTGVLPPALEADILSRVSS